MTLGATASSVVRTAGALTGLADTSFAVALWMRATASSSSPSPSSSPSTVLSAGQLRLQLLADGRVGVSFGGDDAGLSAPLPAPTAASGSGWTHVAVSYASALRERTLLLNGVPVASDRDVAPLPAAFAARVTLGAAVHEDGVSLTQFFAGSIDEVRIFGRALSVHEAVCALTTNALSSESLLAHWRFGEQGGLEAADTATGAAALALQLGPDAVWNRLSAAPVPALPVCFQASSRCTLLADPARLFSLNATLNTALHAPWRPAPSGSRGAGGVLGLDTTAYVGAGNAAPFVDLQSALDNGNDAAVLPASGLGPELAVALWLNVAKPAVNQSLFSCGASADSAAGLVQLNVLDTAGRLQLQLFSAASGERVCARSTASLRLSPNVWQAVSVSVTAAGVVRFAVNGVNELAAGGPCVLATATNETATATALLDAATVRSSCFVGRAATSAVAGLPWSGGVASVDVWSRALSGAEATALAMSPPASLAPMPLAAVNLPAFVAPGATSAPILLQVPLATALSVPLSVSAVGATPSADSFNVDRTNFSPAGLTAMAVAPQFRLTFPAGQTSPVTLSVASSGAASLFYQALQQQLVNATLPQELASAAFDVNMASPSLGAGFAAPNVATFDGDAQWLNFNEQQDVQNGAAPLPTLGGANTGLSFAMWLQWSERIDGQRFFACSAGVGDVDGLLLTTETVGGVPGRLLLRTYSGATLTGNYQSGLALTAGQWIHIAASLDGFGGAQLFVNGVASAQLASMAGFGPVEPVLRAVSRPFCGLAQSHTGAGRFRGQVADFLLWTHPLLPVEAQLLAAHPPEGIMGRIALRNVPATAASPATLVGLVLSTDLILSAPAAVELTVYVNGVVVLLPRTFGGASAAPQTAITFVLGALAAGETSWTVSVGVSGPASSVALYQPFEPIVVQLSRYSHTLASRHYALQTDTPSAHASWQASPVAPGEGFASFDGGQFLDLTTPLVDVGNSGVIAPWGGSQAQPLGFAMSAWVRAPVSPTNSYYSWTLFSCAPSPTDNSDAIWFGFSGQPSTCCSYDYYDQRQ